MATLSNRPSSLNPSRRRRLPKRLCLTDTQTQAAILDRLRRLDGDTALVFRHYHAPDRATLFTHVVDTARQNRQALFIANDARLARHPGVTGLHLSEGYLKSAPRRWRLWQKPGTVLTVAAHDRAAIIRARRAGAHAVLVSPVFATPSHPNAKPLGVWRLGLMVRNTGVSYYALGGMTAARARRLPRHRLAGWAGISFFA